MINAKCRICRRLGVKLFIKGEKCLTPSCPMVKKPYPPGIKSKKRRSSFSEYGRELKEKQKLRRWYNLGELQFKKYIKQALDKSLHAEKEGITAEDLLIKNLEKRFDNLIFRLGFATSRSLARQLVSHGHFLINGKAVNYPSYEVKKGDKISLQPRAKKKAYFQSIIPILKKKQVVSWLKLDVKSLEGEVIGEPSLEEAAPPADILSIFEFYSR